MEALSYEQVWQMQDGVRAVVDTCVGADAVRDMHWDARAMHLVLELSRHLTDDEMANLISQLYVNADYAGESAHGSVFHLVP